MPAAPMPGELVAAAREAGEDDVPVRLELAGARVVAVVGVKRVRDGAVGGDCDPREWWTAIWRLAQPEASHPRGAGISLLPLPAGLAAVVVTRSAGEITLAVSDSVEPDRQRQAALIALDAAAPVATTGPFAVLLARITERTGGLAIGGTRARVLAAAAGALVLIAPTAIALTMTGQSRQEKGVRLARSRSGGGGASASGAAPLRALWPRRRTRSGIAAGAGRRCERTRTKR